MTKKAILIIIFFIVLGATLVIAYIRKNTAYLNFNIPEEQVLHNNTNSDDSLELSVLEEQILIVPDEFKIGIFNEERRLYLPKGFRISVYLANLEQPRFLDFDNENNLYIADKGAGQVILAKSTDNDLFAEETIVIDSGLRNVHSVDFFDNDLFVGEEHQVSVYRDIANDGTFSRKDTIIPDLPAGGPLGTGSGHVTRTVRVGSDNMLYVSVGSSCNICEEEDNQRAAILRFNLDGSDGQVYANGLRNSVGFTFNDDTIWAADNGRDLIGDDLPPEEINIVEQGKHYGWPYCYGNGVVNPEFQEYDSFCSNDTEFPRFTLPAHTAPLGILYVNDDSLENFPFSLRENIFIAMHGSWNSTIPVGYKIQRVDTQTGVNYTFISGWLQTSGEAWGRPVGLAMDTHDYLYISDDRAGAIYVVTYTPGE